MRSKHLTIRHLIPLWFLFTIVCTVNTAHAACAFVGGSTGRIAFNNINPSLPGPILGTVTTQVNFHCNNGRAFTVTAAPASGWNLTSGANSMPYTLGFVASGTGLGGGTLIPLLTNTSQIIMSNYQNAAGGGYTNSQAVTLTISCPTCGGAPIVATIPLGNVTGTIINTCVKQLPSPGTLTFTMDPSVSGTTTATISPDLKIKCTKNYSAIFITSSSLCGVASPKMGLGGCGGYLIPYLFPIGNPNPTGNGFGPGTDISLGIGGSASSVNYANAPLGAYSDIETVTINY